MDVWYLILYAGASVLSLQSLLSLMTSRKREYQQQLLDKHLRQKRAAKKKAKLEEAAAKLAEASEAAA